MGNNIGRILQDLLKAQRTAKHSMESPTERYARIVIKLDDPDYIGTDVELHLKGDYLGKIKYDGNSTGYLKLGHRHAGKIYCGEFRRTWSEYDRIYLTNPTAQAGKILILSVGGAFSGEIEPAAGGKSGIQDSSGADIDPAIKDEYDAALLLISNSLGVMDDWDDGTDRCKVTQKFTGTPYMKSMTTSDTEGVIEGATKLLRSVVIKNTHDANEALLGLTSPVFTLKAGASIALDNIDMHLLYVKTKAGVAHATLEMLGTENA